MTGDQVFRELATICDRPGRLVALTVVPGAGLALAAGDRHWSVPAPDPAAVVGRIAEAYQPRWVWWSAHVTARALVAGNVRLRTCWDLAATHRVLYGGHRDDPPAVWAAVHDLPEPPPPRRRGRDDEPTLLDLAAMADADLRPVLDDGRLNPGWAEAAPDLEQAAQWSLLALRVQAVQDRQLQAVEDPRLEKHQPPLAKLTAYAESAAALLAVELEHDGLPVDVGSAEQFIAGYIGERPKTPAEEAEIRTARDAEVLRHFGGVGSPSGEHSSASSPDLRSPAQVRELLRRLGFELPDTRSWRLEPFRDSHPGVAALLDWRKAERIATTYGYRWLDDHLDADGRVRGGWGASDGAAGRMTAQAGLHSLPAEIRIAVAAEPGHLLVRADLGQIEPRVLAVVSGDPALTHAARSDDMYAPVAEQLECDRPTAKVAVLSAMYGGTAGAAAAALKRMEAEYPKAIAYLRSAEDAGRTGVDIRTWGGRLLRLRPRSAAPVEFDDEPLDADVADVPPGQRLNPNAYTGRGRFARNAVIQGAAAELFKAWAASVRIGLLPYDGRIVLCLHDELLVHVRAEHADATAELLNRALASTARAWAAGSAVRFIADCAIVRRWSEAK
ncbi:DNA polymerase [Flindersiella endophytica]